MPFLARATLHGLFLRWRNICQVHVTMNDFRNKHGPLGNLIKWSMQRFYQRVICNSSNYSAAFIRTSIHPRVDFYLQQPTDEDISQKRNWSQLFKKEKNKGVTHFVEIGTYPLYLPF